ncbi:MAG: hypothetical protein ACUVQP_11235 [Bacteroidales bacterium]
MSKMIKRSLILERMWLVIAFATLILAIFETSRKPFNQTYPLFVIAAISFFMYLLRRTTRRKINS